MKCPFLITRKDVLDNEGKKVGEEIILQDCIKNDCMIYDGATKLCSLLSSNMKTGVLIDDVKNGIAEVKDELFQRTEALGVIFSTTLQTLQEALLGRFDILKKQNEVMVLGFDRLVETITNKFEGLKTNVTEFTSSITTLQNAVTEAISSNIGDLKTALLSLQTSVDDIKQTHSQFSSDVRGFNETLLARLSEYKIKIDRSTESFASKLSLLKEGTDKLTTTYQVGMETVNTEIEKIVGASQSVVDKLGQIDAVSAGITSMSGLVKTELAGLKTETLTTLNNIVSRIDTLSGTIGETMKPIIDDVAGKLDGLAVSLGETVKSQEQGMERVAGNFKAIGDNMKEQMTGVTAHIASTFDGLKSSFDEYFNGVKSEIATLKADQIASFNNVQGTITQLNMLFKESSDSLGSMSDMMKNLNTNYIESLSKIAGLAEGMRKGVDKVGEGMHASVKDLVKEMKSEIGALEKQYEKTFGDIANLAGKFEDLNKHIKEMTSEVEKEFKGSFDRQEKLSDYTKTILEHIKNYFVKEEERYKKEQELRKKKEGLDHFDRATLYYYRGNYELAINEINKALEIEKTAEYLNLKGLLLAELGKFDESKKIYKEALNLEPGLAEIHNNLGLLYLKMKKLGDAVVAFQEAVKKNVNYARAYVNMGKALIDMEKFDDAIKAYEKALDIDPSSEDAQEALRLYKEGKIGA
jgi:tetratricopeptide (TPR) repeat protein